MASIASRIGESGVSDAALTAPQAGFYARRGKRLFDIAASLAGLTISSPFLVLCALLVRLTSRGPVFFRQARIGRRGRPFTLIKFRTMKRGAESLGSAVVVHKDRRLTLAGGFLRRTKLDELPQLFNVLLGQMSIVGPRPRVPSEVDLDDPGERVLLRARPGFTSFASIHHRMEADYCAQQGDPQAIFRTMLLPQKVLLDCEYVNNPSFRLDLRLIALTFLLIFIPGKSLAGKLHILGCEVRVYGRGAQMLLDLGTYAIAACLAYRLRFDAGLPDFYRTQLCLFMALVPPLRVVSNRCLRLYDAMWRYTNVDDGMHLAVALAPVSVVLFVFRLWLPTTTWQGTVLHVPLSIITLEYLLALTAGLGLRALRRMLYVLHHHYQPLPEQAHRVMIFGAGLLGLSTAQDMRRYPHLHLVGFVDDDPTKVRRLMAGERVLGNSEDLEALCLSHKVTDIIICAKSIDPVKLAAISRQCYRLRVKPHMLPGLDRLIQDANLASPHGDEALSFAGHGG